MGVQLTIELGNAAFEDGNRDSEVARIVREVAGKVEDGGPGLSDSIKAYDINGNSVGGFTEVPVMTHNSPESSFVMLFIGETGNAAFEDAGPALEVARIFREAADRIENGDFDFVLRDLNGNRVGHVSATLDDPEDELDVGEDENSNVKPYTTALLYGDKIVDRHGNEWTVGAVAGYEKSEQVNLRTGQHDKTRILWLISEDGEDTVVKRAEPDLMNGMKDRVRMLEYVIDLDERGEFYADVREQNQDSIYVIKGFQLFEDGVMRNSKDIDGLRDHLQELKIIGEADGILDTTRFQAWEREIDERFDRACDLYNDESEKTWFGTIQAADSQHALLESIGVNLFEDPDTSREGDRTTYLVRMTEEAHAAFDPYAAEFTADLHVLTQYQIDHVEPDQHDDRGLAAHVAYLKFMVVAAPTAEDKEDVRQDLREALGEVASRAQHAAVKPTSPSNDADHGSEP